MTHGASSRQQQIMQLLLENKQGLCIDDMAAHLEISRNAIKQHLTLLERDLLIKKHGLNTTKGRPSRNYILTETGLNHFPKQYSWFSNLVLTELKAEMGDIAFQNFIAKLGVKLALSLKQQAGNTQAHGGIAEIIKIMQTLGYQAEACESGIQAYNCVYHDLAAQHPELCIFDRALLSTYLEAPIEQTACMVQHDCACKFLLKKD